MPSPDWLTWEFWSKDTQSLNHLAVIVAGVIGIPLLAIRTLAANKSAKAANAQARTAEQGHITDRFTAAVEQLGSDKMAVRLGAIYALERISKDSRRDYWTIMETLTAFVREQAPWPPRGQALANPFVEPQDSSAGPAGANTPSEQPEDATQQSGAQIRPATDIQAVLTVLGRRDEQARQRDQEAQRSLDLVAMDLRGADFRGAHLEGANLRGAHLERADLREAHLERADLREAHLERADLGGAHLEHADLRRAHLERAALGRAHLERAALSEAHLEGASIWRAHLERADLREAHLERADLGGAHLEHADLRRAHLERADLREAHLEGADLGGAIGLTQEQLANAFCDMTAALRNRRTQR